jgi:hypothetical protein
MWQQQQHSTNTQEHNKVDYGQLTIPFSRSFCMIKSYRIASLNSQSFNLIVVSYRVFQARIDWWTDIFDSMEFLWVSCTRSVKELWVFFAKSLWLHLVDTGEIDSKIPSHMNRVPSIYFLRLINLLSVTSRDMEFQFSLESRDSYDDSLEKSFKMSLAANLLTFSSWLCRWLEWGNQTSMP